MKKIDTKKVLLDLDDRPISFDGNSENKATVGRVIAFMLQGYKGKIFGGDSLKVLELARSFYKKDSVSLDKADFKKIKDVVTEDQQFTPIILGQVIEILDDAKEEEIEVKQQNEDK